jgi:hypothetical protein
MFMRWKIAFALLAGVTFAAAGSVSAHHSFAAEFDRCN